MVGDNNGIDPPEAKGRTDRFGYTVDGSYSAKSGGLREFVRGPIYKPTSRVQGTHSYSRGFNTKHNARHPKLARRLLSDMNGR